MIKIIAILDNEIGAGGGFNQALNALVQMHRLSSNRFNFEVCTTQKNNIDCLNQLGIHATTIKIAALDRLLVKFSQSGLWQSVQRRLKLMGPFEKQLIGRGCDVVYFVTSGNLCLGLQKLNYIKTVWDLAHRETPEFPEVRDFGEFSIREKNYQHVLSSALLTLTDSQRLADMASRYYGIERDRFLAMPFAPTPFLDEAQASDTHSVLQKFNLECGYFFYPAQFWAHKNHIRILQALLTLRDLHGWAPKVVFAGRDGGSLAHIKKFIDVQQLDFQVRILGFVPPEDMRGLYKNAMAVIMPTYFGPTNLPPLDAWSLGVPLIYSAHLVEHAGNAALLCDPDNAIELANAMLKCTEQDVCNQLISAGHQRLADITRQRDVAEDSLCMTLEKFTAKRQCWS